MSEMRTPKRLDFGLAALTWIAFAVSLSVGIAYTLSGVTALKTVLEPKRMFATLLLAGVPFSLLLPALATALLRRGGGRAARLAFVVDVVAIAVAVALAFLLTPVLGFLL